jgi:hypothetical protein
MPENLKDPKDEETRMEEAWKLISMWGSGMITLQGDHLVETLFPRVYTYWDNMSTTKVK